MSSVASHANVNLLREFFSSGVSGKKKQNKKRVSGLRSRSEPNSKSIQIQLTLNIRNAVVQCSEVKYNKTNRNKIWKLSNAGVRLRFNCGIADRHLAQAWCNADESLANEHLGRLLHLAITPFVPRFRQLTEGRLWHHFDVTAPCSVAI